MSIEQPRVIDVIGVDKITDEVILTISDHLDWNNEHEHQLLLQEKINTYLAFIESGEILESYPNAKGRHPVISVRVLSSPTSEGLRFFARVKPIIENAGIGFHFEVAEASS